MNIRIRSRKHKRLIKFVGCVLTFCAIYCYIFELNKITNQKVLIVFSIAPGKCLQPDADDILKESFINKQQYAKIKAYDVIYNNRQIDPRLSSRYNKIALLLDILNKQSNLNETKKYDWLFWIDSDALVVNMAFDIPFYKYEKYNFVLWGDNQRFARDADVASISSGVFLLRNNDWSRRFLEIVATFGYKNCTARLNDLYKGIRNHTPLFQDQSGFAYTLKHYNEFMYYTYFENSYGINRYWKMFYSEKDFQNSFIIHYPGCGFCKKNFTKECFNIWNLFFNVSNSNYNKLIK